MHRIKFCAIILVSFVRQLWIDRTCRVNFGFNDSVCTNITHPEWKHFQDTVQSRVSHYNVVAGYIEHVPPIIISLYLGKHIIKSGSWNIINRFLCVQDRWLTRAEKWWCLFHTLDTFWTEHFTCCFSITLTFPHSGFGSAISTLCLVAWQSCKLQCLHTLVM